MKLMQDMKSKLVDGLLSVILMIAGMFSLIMLFRLFKPLGTWGYVVYGVVMLVASIGLLEWSLREMSAVKQAWTGIWSGFFGWTFLEIGHTIGFVSIEDWDGSTLFVLSILVLTILWQYLPRGGRFWVAIFCSNWGAHWMILGQKHLFSSSGMLKTTFTMTLIACGAAIIGLLYWIFAGAQERVQRLWGGIGLWVTIAIILFVIRG